MAKLLGFFLQNNSIRSRYKHGWMMGHSSSAIPSISEMHEARGYKQKVSSPVFVCFCMLLYYSNKRDKGAIVSPFVCREQKVSPPIKEMRGDTIRFIGKSFHLSKWTHFSIFFLPSLMTTPRALLPTRTPTVL